MIKGVIFDLDGTLTDSMYVWDLTDEELLNEYGFSVDENHKKAMASKNFSEGVAYILEKYNLPLTPQTIAEKLTAKALKHYSQEVRLKKNVAQTLEFLKNRGVKMAVATACVKQMCEATLKRNGVFEYFSSFIYSDETGLSKRDGKIFETAIASIGLKPNECIIVEDALHAAKGAKKTDALVVGVYDEYSKASQDDLKAVCDVYVRDISELKNMFN